MELSDEFIKATKLSNLKYYELATIGGLTQVSFSQYINRTRKIIGDKDRLLSIGEIIGVKKEDVFTSE